MQLAKIIINVVIKYYDFLNSIMNNKNKLFIPIFW